MIKFLALLAILVLCTAGIAAGTNNLVTNGDFSGNLSGWNSSGYYLGTTTVDIDGVGPLLASNSFYTYPAGGHTMPSATYLYQQISLTANTLYTFYADLAAYAAEGNWTAGDVSVYLDNSLIASHNFGQIGSGSWLYGDLSGTYSSTSDKNATLQIVFNRGLTTLGPPMYPVNYIDNVTLVGQSVPEPTAVCSLAGLLSLVGCGIVRRRRRMM